MFLTAGIVTGILAGLQVAAAGVGFLATLISIRRKALPGGVLPGVVLGEFLGPPVRYRAGRIGEFVRVEGPPGLRRAVGEVVHLQSIDTAVPMRTVNQRSSSVALGLALSEDVDGFGNTESSPRATNPDGQDTNS